MSADYRMFIWIRKRWCCHLVQIIELLEEIMGPHRKIRGAPFYNDPISDYQFSSLRRLH